MPNFQNTIIYKLECNKTGLIYIGSTCMGLVKRMCEHRRKRFYCSSQKILLNEDYRKDILFKYPCDSDLEKRMKEQEFIDIYREYYGDLVVNEQNPIADKELRREKDKITHSIIYKNNKDVINKNRRETKYFCEVCNCIIRKDGLKDHIKTVKHIKNFILY